MEKLSLICVCFLIEFIVDVIVLKAFKIYYKKIYLLFLQVPKVCASVLCFVYFKKFFLCLILKLIAMFVCVLFITDTFKIRKIISLIFSEIAILFSVIGFFVFVLLWVNSSVETIFLQKTTQIQQNLLFFLIFLYVFAIFKTVRCIEKNKFLNKFSAKVSFYLNGKHILLYGLMDSGNSLFDPLTRKPVVLVSIDSLKKFFSKTEIDDLLKHCSRKIKCDTVSGSGYEIPIFKIEKFSIRGDVETKKFLCLIGIVSHRFEKGKVDCLLHRDFL